MSTIATRFTGPSVLTGMRNASHDDYTKMFLMRQQIYLDAHSMPVTKKIRHKGTGRGGAKRVRKATKSALEGISDNSIRKLARRGGVKRMSGLVYEHTRQVLKQFLEKLINDTILYTTSAKRKTVNAMDVVMALKKQGRTLYGFN
jgi:histone H4